MTAETPHQIYEKELDKLRNSPKNIEPLDIAKAARIAGLLPHEAVVRIQEYWRYGRPRGRDLFDGLAIFLSALGEPRNVKRIAEVIYGPYMYAARLSEWKSDKELVCVTPHESSAEILRTVFEETTVLVAKNLAEVERGAGFDAIICAPQLGHHVERKGGADGFGGEVVRQLIPFLAIGGTLYWVTDAEQYSCRARRKR